MRRALALAVLALWASTACGRAPVALGAASSSRVSEPTPAASDLATELYPSAPRTQGMLGSGVFGNAMLVSGVGTELGTWYWDGTAWQRPKGDGLITSYFTSGPVFDPPLRKSIAFAGGATGDAFTTWAWDGSTWSLLGTGPPGAGPPLLGFHAATNQFIAVVANPLPDPGTSTWLFEGGRWQRVGGTSTPQSRARTNLAYDPGTRQLILFGGQTYRGPVVWSSLAETWTWDGKAWTERHPHTNPPAGTASLAYDPDIKQLILMVKAAADFAAPPTGISMWSWDGADWHQMNPLLLPALSAFPDMTYDSAHHQLLLIGGKRGGPSSTFQTQTWAYTNEAWTRVG